MPASSRMPPPERSRAGETSGVNEAQDVPGGCNPQDPSIEATGDDGTPVPKTVPEIDMTATVGATASPMMSEAATGVPAASTGPMAGVPSSPPQMVAATTSVGADDTVIMELEVIMGQPGLRAPGQVFLSEVMGTAHFALHKVHYMLHREREDVEEEQLHLSVWGSLLKKWTTYEKEKAEAKRE
jgi:hypothetical protein